MNQSFGFQKPDPRQHQPQAQFRKFSATELFCPQCRRAMPVKEKLLLVLPSGDMHHYVCSGCGATLGKKT